jgi:hypothetical protein
MRTLMWGSRGTVDVCLRDNEVRYACMAWKGESVPDGREGRLETGGASVWEGSSREWYEVTRYESPRC